MTTPELPPLPKAMTILSDLQSGTMEVYDADAVNAFHAAALARIDQLKATLRASCIEEREMLYEATPGGGCGRAIEAEEALRGAALRIEALEEALWQLLDDMGDDGHSVCEDAKQQAITVLGDPVEASSLQSVAAVEGQTPPTDSAPVEATAWIVSGPGGRVYHFGRADGWTVESVLSDEVRIDIERFRRAPCYLCGYNSHGYYQPSSHPCARSYHRAIAQSPKP